MLKRFFPLVVIGLVFGFFVSSTVPTYAQTAIDMKPGQTLTFTVEYQNSGEGEDTLKSALLSMTIGRHLVLDKESMTDQFPETATPNKVLSTLAIVTADSPTTIDYRPRSATTGNTASGTDQPGDTEITIGQKGLFKFRAKLRDDILNVDRVSGTKYVVGDTLSGPVNGITSILDHSGTGKAPGNFSVKIVAPDAIVCTGKSAVGGATGGGFDSTSSQPTNVTVVTTPANPVTVEQALNVKGSGFQDSAECSPRNLNNVPCTVIMQGPSSFSAQVTGTVKNGVCDVNFTTSQTPKNPGTYRVIIEVDGPSGKLRTAPKNVEFVAKPVVPVVTVPELPKELPRSGGLAFAIILAILAAFGGIIAFVLAKRRKLEVETSQTIKSTKSKSKKRS
jgi:hypothetical protein